MSSKKTKKYEFNKKRQFACLCLIALYSFQLIIMFFSGSYDEYILIFGLIFTILCIIIFIFLSIKKKKEDKPPPQEIPFNQE
jgi:L-asparagine transporter-like permease